MKYPSPAIARSVLRRWTRLGKSARSVTGTRHDLSGSLNRSVITPAGFAMHRCAWTKR